MQDRRAGRERRFGREHRGELLVFDLDHRAGRARLRLGFGGDRGDRLADIAHLAFRDRVLVLDARAHQTVGAVVAGDDGLHPGRSERLRDVVALDARVRVRTGEDRRVQHAGPRQVGDVTRAPIHFLARVHPWQAATDFTHFPDSSAALRTASTILR